MGTMTVEPTESHISFRPGKDTMISTIRPPNKRGPFNPYARPCAVASSRLSQNTALLDILAETTLLDQELKYPSVQQICFESEHDDFLRKLADDLASTSRTSDSPASILTTNSASNRLPEPIYLDFNAMELENLSWKESDDFKLIEAVRSHGAHYVDIADQVFGGRRDALSCEKRLERLSRFHTFPRDVQVVIDHQVTRRKMPAISTMVPEFDESDMTIHHLDSAYRSSSNDDAVTPDLDVVNGDYYFPQLAISQQTSPNAQTAETEASKNPSSLAVNSKSTNQHNPHVRHHNADSVLGVSFYEDRRKDRTGRWIAKCVINGKTFKKTFSIGKYGLDGARQKAIDERNKYMKQKQMEEECTDHKRRRNQHSTAEKK